MLLFVDNLDWNPSHDQRLAHRHGVLRIVIVVNWLLGAAIVALFTATIVAEQWTMTAIGIPSSPDNWPLTMRVRAIAALGLVAIPLNYAVLKRLLAIVETVRKGDPFVGANANRLQAIAWALCSRCSSSVCLSAASAKRF